ncbi:MAG: hypothetical protein J6T50_08890, partial [Lachnospiraceae bacterium]|nr:hypothetical protein [Lachnospiraceae bacterium]
MYEYDIRIGYSRVDEEQKLSIPSLIDIMQDASTFQSEDLGLGISYCREKNVFWVLNSWQVEIDRLPGLCEKVTVFTFPVDFNRFLGTRCFGIRSGNDIIVRAYSVWTLLDTETYKPALLTEDMIERYKKELLVYPAAKTFHHAVRSGLLYHTYTMLRGARHYTELYPELKGDLLHCGVILHDIG